MPNTSLDTDSDPLLRLEGVGRRFQMGQVAVEALKDYGGILHGEAVAIGMAFAAERSETLGLSPRGTKERLVALLHRAGLPTELPVFPRRAYLQALRVDKKKREARIRFVALRGIGRAETMPLLPREIMPPVRSKTRR